MQSEAALVLLAIAVAVSSLALLIQAVAAVRIMRSVRKLEEEILPLVPQARQTILQAQNALKLA
ncbi:MAG: hypothetical protein N2036_07000, partial [Bryobacteraceae bacterium]|nr:hypothetical protein [Bryobacteraceae bacterium]